MDRLYELAEASNQLLPQPENKQAVRVLVKSKIQERLDRLVIVQNQLPEDHWLADPQSWGDEFTLQAEQLECDIQQRLDLERELSDEGSGSVETLESIGFVIPNARNMEDEEEDSEEMEDEEDSEEMEDEEDSEEMEDEDEGQLQRSATKFFRLQGIRLMRAAKAGNYAKVEKLLKDRACPNFKTLRWTPLMWASHRGHWETMRILLQYGADPNITATNGYTALMLASRKGHHDVVRLLLDRGNRFHADVNARNNTRGWSALMWASQTVGTKRRSLTEWALENRGGIFRTKRRFLTEKAMGNRRKVAQVLLEAGADVNLNANNGWSPLMQASQDGDVEMVKILVSAKYVAIDRQSKNTWSALTTACRRGHEDIVQVLLDAGANANLKKKGAITALHIACYKGLVRAVKSLVAGGAAVDVQDNWGVTPLMYATKQNNLRLMKYLIVDARANVDARAEKYAQWSPLLFAVKNGNHEAVDLLLTHRAETCTRDEYGHTPLSYSKGLFLQKKVLMYKHLVKILFPEDEYTPDMRMSREILAMGRKSFTPSDGVFYTGTEVAWRTRQLPNLLLNI